MSDSQPSDPNNKSRKKKMTARSQSGPMDRTNPSTQRVDWTTSLFYTTLCYPTINITLMLRRGITHKYPNYGKVTPARDTIKHTRTIQYFLPLDRKPRQNDYKTLASFARIAYRNLRYFRLSCVRIASIVPTDFVPKLGLPGL